MVKTPLVIQHSTAYVPQNSFIYPNYLQDLGVYVSNDLKWTRLVIQHLVDY